MSAAAPDRLPEDRRPDLERARRLEFWTVAYLVSAIGFMALVFSSSQAMKTVWLEDMLSLAPPILFLLGGSFSAHPPDARYPYGRRRLVSVAYLGAATALLLLGGYLLVDAAIKLVEAEHPTIGGVELFGHVVWLGWLMLLPLTWSAVPAVFLGRAKLPLAERLHDKVLLADAEMNKADWMTAVAGMAGILGVALGLWWADSAAAALISLDILHDGIRNLRAAANDLVNRRPQRLPELEADPLPDELAEMLRRLDWVQDAAVRLREEGRFLAGEAFVVPRREDRLPERIEQAVRAACESDWRLCELVVTPVRRLPDWSPPRIPAQTVAQDPAVLPHGAGGRSH